MGQPTTQKIKSFTQFFSKNCGSPRQSLGSPIAVGEILLFRARRGLAKPKKRPPQRARYLPDKPHPAISWPGTCQVSYCFVQFANLIPFFDSLDGAAEMLHRFEWLTKQLDEAILLVDQSNNWMQLFII